MNWVDVVVILICIACLLIGIWRGLFKSVVSLFGNSVVFLGSFALCKPTAAWIMKITTWDTSLASKISSWLSGLSSNFDVNMVGMSSETLNSHVSETLNTNGFPGIFKFIFKLTTKITPDAIANKTSFTMNDMISQTLTILTFILTCFVVFLIVFFVLKFVLLRLVKNLSETHLSFSFVDKSLGALFGILHGLVYVFTIFAILHIFKFTSFYKTIYGYIQTSVIGSRLANFTYTIVDKYFNITTMINFIKVIT